MKPWQFKSRRARLAEALRFDTLKKEQRVLENPHNLTAWCDLLPALEGRALNVYGKVYANVGQEVRTILQDLARVGTCSYLEGRLLAIKNAMAIEPPLTATPENNATPQERAA